MKKKNLKLKKLKFTKEAILNMQTDQVTGGISATACITNPFVGDYSCNHCEPVPSAGLPCGTVPCASIVIC